MEARAGAGAETHSPKNASTGVLTCLDKHGLPDGHHTSLRAGDHIECKFCGGLTIALRLPCRSMQQRVIARSAQSSKASLATHQLSLLLLIRVLLVEGQVVGHLGGGWTAGWLVGRVVGLSQLNSNLVGWIMVMICL